MASITKIGRNGQPHSTMGPVEMLFAGLVQRDQLNGTPRMNRLRRIPAALAVLGALGLAGCNVLSTPDTHGDGIVRIADGHIDLRGKAGSGDYDFDAALRLINAGVAIGEEEQGLVLDVSQEDREKVAKGLATYIHDVDTNPKKAVIDFPAGQQVAVTFENGQLQGAGIVPVPAPDAK
ncbi:hypothetical protein KDA14_00245 [Candidatus Saccharibacteria bacterium]|nr:hypothetical protein [Candidatus Saccharibacteria bacterium]